MSLSQVEPTTQKTQNELDAIAIRDAGWVQGAVFLPTDLELPFVFDPVDEFLIITTQSCSVVSSRFEVDPFVEAMAVRKLREFRDRSPEASGKNQRKLHLKLIKGGIGCPGIECDINRRVFLDRKNLLTTVPIPDLSVGEPGAKKLANWIARHYIRIALPDNLVLNMRRHLLPTLEKILKQDYNGQAFHSQVDSIYITYQAKQVIDHSTFFTIKFLFLCNSQDSADELDFLLSEELNNFFMLNGKDSIFIEFLRCGIRSDTFLSDLEGYDRFSEWDYFTNLVHRFKSC